MTEKYCINSISDSAYDKVVLQKIAISLKKEDLSKNMSKKVILVQY